MMPLGNDFIDWILVQEQPKPEPGPTKPEIDPNGWPHIYFGD